MWFCKINLYCCDLSCFVVSVFGTVSWQIGGCKNSCERERPSSVTRKWSFCFQHLGMVRFSVVASKNIATQCSLCCVFRLTWRLSTPEPGTASCIKAHKPNGGQGKWAGKLRLLRVFVHLQPSSFLKRRPNISLASLGRTWLDLCNLTKGSAKSHIEKLRPFPPSFFIFVFSCLLFFLSSFLSHILYLVSRQPTRYSDFALVSVFSFAMGDSTVKSIFSSIDSIITFALVCIEAVLICFLEGFVVNNHLALVSNCQVNNTPAGLTIPPCLLYVYRKAHVH